MASLGTAASRKDDPKIKYIPVPSDHALASMPCPICQEKFEVSRDEELQDFVWTDAIKIGGRVYHATCYADLQKDGGNTPRTSTPDSILGKRKAEVSWLKPIGRCGSADTTRKRHILPIHHQSKL